MVLCAFDNFLASDFGKSSRKLIRRSSLLTGSLKRAVVIKSTFSLVASLGNYKLS